MAKVIITLKIMPSGIEVNLSNIEKEAVEEIEKFGGSIAKITQEPIAFGLKALVISFFSEESKSNLDPLEESISKLTNVESVSVAEVRRALG